MNFMQRIRLLNHLFALSCFFSVGLGQVQYLGYLCSCYDRTDGTPLSGVCCNLDSKSCTSTIRNTAVCQNQGNGRTVICPRILRKSAQGHFISGSISWRVIGENFVEFEIHSVWRLSFNWPYENPISLYTGISNYILTHCILG